jgi:hypothetical protein
LKNTNIKILFLSIVLSINLASCQKNSSEIQNGLLQKVDLKFDNRVIPLSATSTNKGDDLYSSSFVKSPNNKFSISIISEKNDFQLALITYMEELKIGTYQVYKCGGLSDCDKNQELKNQEAGIVPYPKKDGSFDANLAKIAYNAPKKGLSPMVLTITEITDRNQLGSPYPTKRVKGKFNGSVAAVTNINGTIEILGSPTKIDAEFDLVCIVLSPK